MGGFMLAWAFQCRRVACILPFLAGFLGLAFGASAAELKIKEWRGHRVLLISGMIDDGTVEKLDTALKSIDVLPYGLPVILLDSPGGSVDEALEISALLDRVPVHTVVPDGARCASACASIIFVAGSARTVEEFGALGQHSCSRGGIADSECNEEISNHAVSHGVSYGSIAAFITYVAPSEIMWFSREDAEGWGLTKYPGENLSGFEKSEPRVIRMITGQVPPAQSAWRINFREDGFQAFVRTASDFEREMQINVFCDENLSGRLFLAMEVNGPVDAVRDAVQSVSIATDGPAWNDQAPFIWQKEDHISEIVTEIPKKEINNFLTRANRLVFGVSLADPYQPMVATTWLNKSRKVLLFAANNCVGK